MTDSVDFRVIGAPRDALSFAQQVFGSDGYRVTAQTEWTCLLEKGSSAKRALAGGLAERSILKLSVFDGGEGATLLRVEKQGSGWSGGVIGAQRATKAFAAATQLLGWNLQSSGRLIV